MTQTSFHKPAGYAIHALTAFGAVVAMFALQALFDGDIRMALIWLWVTQIIDGLDGPIARRHDVVLHAPRIDGHVLDLVVDFVACVIVPVAFMAQTNMLRSHSQTLLVGIIMLTSALWFARTDLETEENWFNGFPAVWNLAIPSLFLLNTSVSIIEVTCVVLAMTQLTNFQFPHIVRSEWMRKITLPFGTIYLLVIGYASFTYNNTAPEPLHPALGAILLIFPLYALGIGAVRTFRQYVQNPKLSPDMRNSGPKSS